MPFSGVPLGESQPLESSVLGLSSVVLIFEEGPILSARGSCPGTAGRRKPAIATVGAHAGDDVAALVERAGAQGRRLFEKAVTDGDDALPGGRIRRGSCRFRVCQRRHLGSARRQFQVLVDPVRLRSHSVTSIRGEGATDAVSLSGGGFVDTPNQRIAVRQVNGVRTAETWPSRRRFSLGRSPAASRRGRYRRKPPAPIGRRGNHEGPGLLLIVEKQPWGNTLT